MGALSRAALVLSALSIEFARAPAVPNGAADNCPWGCPGCAGAAAEADEAAHLQLKESVQQQGGRSSDKKDDDRVQCPGSGAEHTCSGDQCCPGTDASAWETFPCPTASPGFDKCQSPEQPPGGQVGQSACEGYDVRIDWHYGGDTLKTLPAGDDSTCCSACDAFGSNCSGWAFVEILHTCYLREGVGWFYHSPGDIAAAKHSPPRPEWEGPFSGTDLTGPVIGQVPATDPYVCGEECKKNSDCGGCVFYQDTCYFKQCGSYRSTYTDGRVAITKPGCSKPAGPAAPHGGPRKAPAPPSGG